MFVSGPLLALASSFERDYELDRATDHPDIPPQQMAPPGPPILAGDAWHAAIANSDGPRPNVLLVILESIAPSHMSLYGYERQTTPRLDELAESSLHLTRAWTTATHSNYAQPAILSSLFPRRRHGLDMYKRLDYPRVLLHDTLHLLGYETATISSQDENWQGMRRFYDTGTPTFFWAAENHTGPKIDSGVEQYAPDDATTEVALDWLSRPRDAPWALYLNYQGTHFPYTIADGADRRWLPDEPNWSTFGYLGYPESDKEKVINRYDNALRFVDEQLGRVFDYLVAADEMDDTIIVITSDHGEMFFERGLVTHGKVLNEIESRVPILFHWPGRIEGEERDTPASHLDIMPTLALLLEIPPHPSWQGTAVDRLDHRRPIYMNIQGLRFADAIICWPHKLILERTSKKQYLYDLSVDAHERDNLIDGATTIASLLEDTLSKMFIAQLDYHANGAARDRYQPRLRLCPDR